MKLSRKGILLLATGCLFFTSVAMSSYSLFLPALLEDFQWSRAVATLPFTVAMVAWGVFAPFSGKLLDNWGTRPVILAGVLCMAIGFFLMGLAGNLWQLMLGYGVLVGVAYGAAGTSVISILVSKHFSAEQRATAVGFSQIANPANPLLLAPLIFWLINYFGWEVAAFAISAALFLIAFPLAWMGARDPEEGQESGSRRITWKESLAYFRDPHLQRLVVARFACGLGFFLIAHLVPLGTSGGISRDAAAAAVSVYGGSAVLGCIIAGKAADRYGRGRILGLTYFLRGLGVIGLAFFVSGNLSFYLLVALAAGPIFGTIAVNNVMIYERVGPRAAGTVLGLGFALHQVAAALSPLVGGLVFDATGTYRWFLVGLGLITICSGFLTINLNTPEPLPVLVGSTEMVPLSLQSEKKFHGIV